MTLHLPQKLYYSLQNSKLLRLTISPLFNAIYEDIDAVRVVTGSVNQTERSPVTFSSKPMKWRMNRRYLPSFLMYLIYIVNFLAIIAHYGPKDIPDNVFPSQKLLPANLRSQADVFINCIVLMASGACLCFLFHRLESFERQFRMFAVLHQDGTLKVMYQGGRLIEYAEAKAIFKLHVKAKILIEIIYGVIIIECLPFYLFNIFNNWEDTFQDYFTAVWVVLSVPHFVINIYVVIFCFILNGRYLRIKQRNQICLLNNLNKTITKFQRIIKDKRPPQGQIRFQMQRILWRFLASHRRLDELHREIQGLNAFWSRYLSVYFAGLTTLIVYFAYMYYMLTDKAESPIVTIFLVFFGTILMAMLLWITYECSVIVYNNVAILQLQRVFCVHLQRAWWMHHSVLLKFDHIESRCKAASRIGFTLFECIRINSRLFEMIFAYISASFMKLVGEK